MAAPREPRRPSLRFAPEMLVKAQGPSGRIRLALFDVDGVLTDGRLYIGAAGESFKAFHTLDGMGLKLLRAGGIEPVIITGRDSPAVRFRVAELGLVHAHYGVQDKLAVAEQVLTQHGQDWAATAAIGDDWPDLPLLLRAGFACAPGEAHAEVRAVAHHITAAAAGEGAAREFCDLLLMASGRYVDAYEAHANAPLGR